MEERIKAYRKKLEETIKNNKTPETINSDLIAATTLIEIDKVDVADRVRLSNYALKLLSKEQRKELAKALIEEQMKAKQEAKRRRLDNANQFMSTYMGANKAVFTPPKSLIDEFKEGFKRGSVDRKSSRDKYDANKKKKKKQKKNKGKKPRFDRNDDSRYDRHHDNDEPEQTDGAPD